MFCVTEHLGGRRGCAQLGPETRPVGGRSQAFLFRYDVLLKNTNLSQWMKLQEGILISVFLKRPVYTLLRKQHIFAYNFFVILKYGCPFTRCTLNELSFRNRVQCVTLITEKDNCPTVLPQHVLVSVGISHSATHNTG